MKGIGRHHFFAFDVFTLVPTVPKMKPRVRVTRRFERTQQMSFRRKTLGERPSNGLLQRLNDDDFGLFATFLEQAEGFSGDVLYYPGDQVEVAHFPCESTMVSMLVSVENGIEVETVLIGREGAVGGIVSHGFVPAFSRMVVKLGGPLVRLPVRKLEEAERRSPSLKEVFTRYRDCLLGQTLQSTACNAAHTVEQRAAKWIITAIEHSDGDRVSLTQEQLAGLLGVGRSYTSRVMQVFKAEGVLENERGAIVIRDLAALQGKTCQCNNSVKMQFEEALPGVYPVMQG
jgi:hypothetical protein